MSEKQETRPGRLFVVSGPSGSGKSSLCREAARRSGVHLSVSATTRAKGPQETDGEDYYFLDEAAFRAKVEAREFLEYARVFDHWYGTPAGPVERELVQGRNVILEIDVQGAVQVFANCEAAVGVLVLPPSDEELMRRLRGRGRDDEATMRKRLAKAQWEVEQAKQSGRYAYTIVNDDFSRALDELLALVASAGASAGQGKDHGEQ